MSYTVKQLSDLSGVTIRALHHYDNIGLLSPAFVKKNGYRVYDELELLKLQQIMFFRELDFPLEKIKKIINSPDFDITLALKDHRKFLELKKHKMDKLIKTIDKTIKRVNQKTKMQDDELYKSFKDHEAKYADEVKERWGNTEAYKQSQERYKKLSKEDILKLKKDGDTWMKNLVAIMGKGPRDTEVQKMIGQHYNSLRTFYEPNLKMYRGLADMYVSDPRFTATYEKYAKGLAVFMRDAMHIYCDQNE